MNFEELIKAAEGILFEKEKGVATAILTNKGNLHVIFCNDFCQQFGEKFCDKYLTLKRLIAKGETRVLKITTVFKVGKEHGAELPCGWLRNFIYEMNHENLDSEVMVGNNIYTIKALMPPSFFGKDGFETT